MQKYMLFCAHKLQHCGRKPAVLVHEFIPICFLYRTNKCLKLFKSIS